MEKTAEFIRQCEATPQLAFELLNSLTVEEIQELAKNCHIAFELVRQYCNSGTKNIRKHQIEYARSQWLKEGNIPKPHGDAVVISLKAKNNRDPDFKCYAQTCQYDGLGVVLSVKNRNGNFFMLTDKEMKEKIFIPIPQNKFEFQQCYASSKFVCLPSCTTLGSMGKVFDRWSGQELYTLSGNVQDRLSIDDPDKIWIVRNIGAFDVGIW